MSFIGEAPRSNQVPSFAEEKCREILSENAYDSPCDTTVQNVNAKGIFIGNPP